MGMLKISQVTCPTDQNCSQWAKKHMDYCLCSKKDGVSLALGLISVLTWSVAEIPQIITNYKQKSTHGLSILFLLTWVIGDFLNLFGCTLEPATLPTQYYLAVLYTVTTLILSAQAIYYCHIYHRLKCNRQKLEVIQAGGIDKKQVNNAERLGNAPSSPIPLPAISHDSSHEELYYMSARSLSISHTPAEVSFQPRRTPDAEEHGAREPLLGEARSTQSAPPLKTKTMLCVVSLMTFFIGGLNLQQAETGRHNIDFRNPTSGVVLQVGRQILQVTGEFEKETSVTKSSEIGSFLGWGMAAIYLGGRLPQICLNIRRGNAEGLNPLMFVFAIVGNATYVASILVSSLQWSKIRPNLPWLVDAGGCVLLDTFVSFVARLL
ncbi:PQ-loop repeat family protein/transmembrane family protein [Forsythia ovata]|uniref:PQ-loop repeat family protein/transmembrane family protein n=1 Tax=Forsythia ovata TaxID=205694 RepID=A0ABD1SNP2_9LAMI